jgi:hypothetical protein
MVSSRIFVYSCLFLVIFVFIPSVKSKCRCCGENGHNIRTCLLKDNCPLNDQKEYNRKVKPTIPSRVCYFEIEGKSFQKNGKKFKTSCNCAKKGDERCHGIADMLGGSENCDNCMSCSHKMNTDMKRMERFVKNSDGGVYIVACDNYKHAKIITQIFSPYKGNPTTTVIFRESPTNYRDEF